MIYSGIPQSCTDLTIGWGQQWRSYSSSEHQLAAKLSTCAGLIGTLEAISYSSKMPLCSLTDVVQSFIACPKLWVLESGKTYVGRLQREVPWSKAVAKYQRGTGLKHCGSSNRKEQSQDSGLLSSRWELSEWANGEMESNAVQREHNVAVGYIRSSMNTYRVGSPLWACSHCSQRTLINRLSRAYDMVYCTLIQVR